jgi:hypothetical protein
MSTRRLQVIIEYEGKSYDFDFEDITVKQAMKIEKHTGLSLEKFAEAAAEGKSLVVVQAVGWLILHGGRDSPIEECDFKLGRLGTAFAKAAAEEEAAEKAREEAAAGPVPTAAVSTVPPPVNGARDLSPVSSAGVL